FRSKLAVNCKGGFMRKLICLIAVASSGIAQDFKPETIIAIERKALDRWGKGEPQGYLETYSGDVTYFDPFADKRFDGMAAMKELLMPLVGKIKVDSYEMIGHKVQRYGDVAVLSYNLASHAKSPNGEPMTVRWNSTAVYARIKGEW